ncbi:MAG: putative mycofactocin-associated electron transfer flavoprotein [Streptosporangiales bacterium]|nr:putative mycofactocin-associated electron transfer flavoprotein [Streptosporangiales bacterium]
MSAPARAEIRIGVALKPVPRHVDVDPLTGAVSTPHAPARAGAADLAALEIALRLREAWTAADPGPDDPPATETRSPTETRSSAEPGAGGVADAAAGAGRGRPITVLAVCAAPAEQAGAADAVLRDALAMGTTRAIRAEVAPGTPGTAASVRRSAEALAAALTTCDIVLCGDYSDDGGTGAVPALLAAAGDRAQALGLVKVEPDTDPGVVRAERRLDRGRRERLRVRSPMVLSVEGTAARPRRAALPALLHAREATIEVVPAAPAAAAAEPETPPRTAPFRPRARALPPPAGTTPRERVLDLLGAGAEREPPRRVDADPPDAAREIVDQLRRWGYL